MKMEDSDNNDISSSLIGTCIDGYEILKVIGEGGFGTVYLASQEIRSSIQIANSNNLIALKD